MPTLQQINHINKLVYEMIEREEESEEEIPEKIGNALSYETIWKDTFVKLLDRLIGKDNCNRVLHVADGPDFYNVNYIEHVVNSYLDYPKFD